MKEQDWNDLKVSVDDGFIKIVLFLIVTAVTRCVFCVNMVLGPNKSIVMVLLFFLYLYSYSYAINYKNILLILCFITFR